ncbi:MAG: hypothetical protein M1818_005582 [Claussenomyces sp. TS43310]|nr:MAG: hypothetical protein M1818_005582 [Claussenomyces sp. TS43310]
MPGEAATQSLMISATRSVSLQKLRLPGETFVLEFPNVDRSTLPYIHHFVNFCCRFIAYYNDNQANPFYEELVPFATTSPALLHSMVALAAGHLSRVHPGHGSTAAKHYALAVHELNTTLSSPAVARSTSTLGACLLLCVFEISRSDRKVWYKHLQGARDLIMYQGGPRSSSFLTRFFALLDVSGSLFAGRGPLLPGNYWVEDMSSRTKASGQSAKRAWPHYDAGNVMVDHFHELMTYMVQISSLSFESLAEAKRDSSFAIQEKACKIRDEILAWWETCPTELKDQEIDWRTKSGKLSAAQRLEKEAFASTRTCVLGCVLYLNHIVDPLGIPTAKHSVASAIQEILAHVVATPENAGLEMGLFYGLFTVGVALYKDPEREALVRRRLGSDMKVSLYHAKGPLELLELVWEKQHKHNKRFDWRKVQEEMGGYV